MNLIKNKGKKKRRRVKPLNPKRKKKKREKRIEGSALFSIHPRGQRYHKNPMNPPISKIQKFQCGIVEGRRRGGKWQNSFLYFFSPKTLPHPPHSPLNSRFPIPDFKFLSPQSSSHHFPFFLLVFPHFSLLSALPKI